MMMKNWAQYPVAVVLGLMLLFGGIYAGHRILFPALPLVAVIQLTLETKSFEDCLQGVMDGLREEGFQDGLNIRLEVENIQGKKDEAAAAAREFREKGASLLITVGTVPTLIALEVTRGSKIPIVYAHVGAPDATGLARPAPPAPLRFTGTTMRVPALEQLRFFLMARPGIKRLGILFCTATPPAAATGEEAEKASPELGLTPIKRTVPDDRPESLRGAVTDLLNQRIDALFIPSDPVLDRPRDLKIICDLTTRALVPVMVPGGSSLASGPLLAYHCDFVEMGRQSGRQAARLLKGVPLEQVPPESPDIKKLTINLKAAHDLQLSLSRQLLSQADQFYQ
jgi:putative ABC transport system substrate-binding protein